MSQSSPLSRKIIPARNAAKRASAHFEEQLMSSEDEMPSSPFGEPSKAKRTVIKTYSSRTKPRTSLGAGTTPPKYPATKPVGRKRLLDLESDDPDSEVSGPLSPLSSPAKPTPRRFQRAKSIQNLAVPRATLTKRGLRAITPPPATRVKRIVDETWNLANLGSFVWVLVDQCGKPVEKQQLELDGAVEQMWWPGKISSPNVFNRPLSVSLIGKASDDFASAVSIPIPSSSNVLSLLTTAGDLRFEAATFRLSQSLCEVTASPRKRRKTDDGKPRVSLETRWRAAVAQMMEEHEIDNDGLPGVDTAYSDGLYGSARKVDSYILPKERKVAKTNAKGKRIYPSDSDLDSSGRWSPPPQDSSLTIPGELILAKEPKGSYFWPAKVEEYCPPTNLKQKAKYKVRYLDETDAVLLREHFFTSDQDGFATCKIGEWTSNYKDVVNDEDHGNEREIRDEERAPSPLATIPLPGDFGDLSMAEQFAYTKPVLTAILNGEYPPACKRHEDFIKGGTARKSVTDNACSRGAVVPEDVDRLQEHLLWWALRGEQRAKRLDVDEPAIPIVPVRDPDTAKIDAAISRSLSPLSSGAELPPVSATTPDSAPVEIVQSSSPGLNGIVKVPDMIVDETPPEPTKTTYRPPPRQRGCQAYEDLSAIEKLEYCSNVLLPEAILQILLWRSGDRQTPDLYPPEEEGLLHRRGVLKSLETDWVRDVMRLREATERSQKRLNTRTAGTRSRPERKSMGRV